jgi:hypothetical protein
MVFFIGARHVAQLFEVFWFRGGIFLVPPILIIHEVTLASLSIDHLDTSEQIPFSPVQFVLAHALERRRGHDKPLTVEFVEFEKRVFVFLDLLVQFVC